MRPLLLFFANRSRNLIHPFFLHFLPYVPTLTLWLSYSNQLEFQNSRDYQFNNLSTRPLQFSSSTPFGFSLDFISSITFPFPLKIGISSSRSDTLISRWKRLYFDHQEKAAAAASEKNERRTSNLGSL